MILVRLCILGIVASLLWCADPTPSDAIRTATVLAGPRNRDAKVPLSYSTWKTLVIAGDVAQLSKILDDPTCTDAGIAYALLGLRECKSEMYEKYIVTLKSRLDNEISLRNGCVYHLCSVSESLTLTDFVVVDFIKANFPADRQ